MPLALVPSGPWSWPCPTKATEVVTCKDPTNGIDNTLTGLKVRKTSVADVAKILIDPTSAAVVAVELAGKRLVATMDVVHDEAIEAGPMNVAAAIAGAPIGDSCAAWKEERDDLSS